MNFRCAVCGKLKIRTHVPTATKTYRYLDEYGKAWNYRQCPPCAYKVRVKSKSKPKQAPENLGPSLEVKITSRRCRICDKFLTEASYYWHEECRPAAYYTTETITYSVIR